MVVKYLEHYLDKNNLDFSFVSVNCQNTLVALSFIFAVVNLFHSRTQIIIDIDFQFHGEVEIFRG